MTREVKVLKTGRFITLARKLRLAVVHMVYERHDITQVEAQDLLSMPLVPGDELTRYDDSQLLGDPNALDKIK